MEELKLRTKCNRCGRVGHWAREVRKNRRKVTKEVGKEVNPGRKMNSFQRKRGERRTSVTGAPETNDTVLRKPGFVFVPPSVVKQNVKRKPEMDLAELPRTPSLEQVTDLMREIQQQDVCGTEVDLAEVMWQESDAVVWNTLAHELETVVECLPAEEDDAEDIEMPGDELRDRSEGEEQGPVEDGEQRDGSEAEHADHSKRDLERVKKSLRSSGCDGIDPCVEARSCIGVVHSRGAMNVW